MTDSRIFQLKSSPGRYRPKLEKKGGRFGGIGKYIILFAILSVLIIGGGMYFLSQPSFLKVNQIIVLGNLQFPEELIIQEVQAALVGEIFRFISQNNILLVREKELVKNLSERFPNLNFLKIEKNILKRSLTITVEERKSMAIWCKVNVDGVAGEKEELKNCFYLDENGMAFNKAPILSSGSLIPMIKDYGSVNFRQGEDILKPEVLAFILYLKNKMPPKMGYQAREFKLFSGLNSDLTVMTQEGLRLLFDYRQDASLELNILKTILDEKVKKENQPKLDYIDLRGGNKVYYKFRD